ncbi:MAG: MFS transporter [Xanthomonadaceae bacterium]|nr:MFS transporter [Xanthomonadaceae bacterium]
MTFAVWLAAFGYFVDVYDLLLFSIVRIPSLRAIGVADIDLMSTGVFLINLQMFGLLCGGWLWGILGDRYGRKSVLLGSILLYSAANLLNAFVTDVPTYAVLRFIAGFGLAGELGAAITLIAESLPTSQRTWGAMIIAMVGMFGAVTAGVFSEFFTWRVCYGIGGLMGLALLIGRHQVSESPLFKREKKTKFYSEIKTIFLNPEKIKTYFLCVAVGVPLWFTSGLLITFAPEFTRNLGVIGDVSVGRGILICYGAASLGDIGAGFLSNHLQSRKKTIAIFMLGTWIASAVYLWVPGLTSQQVYLLFALMGIAGGYWATYVLYAAEQFGTKIRSTVTVSIPNMVRGAVVVMVTAFQFLTPHVGVVRSASFVGIAIMILAYSSLNQLRETFSRNLNFD